MDVHKYRKILLSLILALLVASVVFIQRNVSEMDERITVVLQLLEVVGVVFTVVFTIQQLHDSKEIARASFIMELNQNYVGNKDYMDVYNKLQSRFDAMQAGEELTETEYDIDKGSISNYLTFFETIYILKTRKIISFDIIDDLFAYRFFLAVHSDLFQAYKLKTQPDNFKNIFKLEKEWLEYRIRINKISQKDLDEAY
ncbi:MAG: hypothetical protein K6F03_08610 [Saccharofermentans sp.]|nr:hypothetical protein [Saccharofermentans sp.]